MGLTIHYSALLKERTMLPQLTNEVADICQTMGWSFEKLDSIVKMKDKDVSFEPPIDDDQNVHLQGIMFVPTGCETVDFTFLSSGWTSSYLNLMSAKKFQVIDSEPIFKDFPKLVYTIHTKTQYGGPDVHVALVHMFKYLENKYFSILNVSDEGHYWETMDKAVLQERFDEYTQLINSFKSAIEKDNWTITHDPFPLTTKMGEYLDKREGEA